MQYISPVRFFNFLEIPMDDEVDVKQLKKLVNLEFLSSETGIVNIEGIDYNKQDLLQLLSDEHFVQHWHFHLQIWDNKPLLDVLEREAIDLKQLPEVLTFRDNPEFCQFVSPYFATPFSSIAKVLLNEAFIRDVYLWMQCRYYIAPEENEVAYDSLRRYLEEALYLFRNINNANYENKLPDIKRWESSDWATVLNALPDYLFHYRDAIAEGLTHVLVVVQSNEKALCYVISSWLVTLDITSPQLKETIKKNHQVFDKYVSLSLGSSDKKSIWEGRWIYWVIIIVVKFVLSMGSCNDSTPKSNNDYDYNVNVNTPILNLPVTKTSVNTVQGEKTTEKETVHNNLTYAQMASVYHDVYRGDTIAGTSNLEKRTYGLLPIYISVFENEKIFLQPFKVENKTSKDLIFIYFLGANAQMIQLNKNEAVYCRPNENQSMDFLLDVPTSKGIQEGVTQSFAMNGAQSIAFTVHKPGEIKQVDNTNPYIVQKSNEGNVSIALTIIVSEANGKYCFSTQGAKVYYLTKK